MLLTELADPRLEAALTSITRVEVQEDLLAAKVYVSVMGDDERAQKLAVAALNSARGRIHRRLREEISLRHVPTLTFLTDERFKGTLKTWEVIRQAMDEIREKERLAAGEGEQAEDEEQDSDDEE